MRIEYILEKLQVECRREKVHASPKDLSALQSASAPLGRNDHDHMRILLNGRHKDLTNSQAI